MAGHDDQNIPCFVETHTQIELGSEIFRKPNARQIALIDPITGHEFQIVAVDIPQPDNAAASSKLQCKRCAPGAGADYRDRTLFGAAAQRAPPLPPLPPPDPSASRCCWLCA